MNRIDTWTIFVKLLKVCKSLTIKVLQISQYLKKERQTFPNRIGQQSLNVLYKGFNGLPSYCIGMSFFFLMTTTIPSAFMMTLTLYILLAMHEYSLLWSWWLGWYSPYQWKSSWSMRKILRCPSWRRKPAHFGWSFNGYLWASFSRCGELIVTP